MHFALPALVPYTVLQYGMLYACMYAPVGITYGGVSSILPCMSTARPWPLILKRISSDKEILRYRSCRNGLSVTRYAKNVEKCTYVSE